MRLIIESDYKKLSAWAARHVVERINAFGPTEERPFVLGLPTGSSPEGMYAELVKANREGRVSFLFMIGWGRHDRHEPDSVASQI